MGPGCCSVVSDCDVDCTGKSCEEFFCVYSNCDDVVPQPRYSSQDDQEESAHTVPWVGIMFGGLGLLIVLMCAGLVVLVVLFGVARRKRALDPVDIYQEMIGDD